MATINIWDNTEDGFRVDPFDDHSDIKDPITRIVSVYQDVWNEFYSWEDGHCATIIDELLAISPGLSKITGKEPDQAAFETDEGVDIQSSISDDSFVIVDYDSDNGGRKTRLGSVNIPFKSSRDPHPRYQMCTPIGRNIAWRIGDWNDQITIPFLPYSDEENFDMHKYLDSFDGHHPPFEWQNMVDPDREMIELETVRRLQFLCNVSIEEIEVTRVFVSPVLKAPEDGLIWCCAQRDQLRWPGDGRHKIPYLSPSLAPDSASIEARVNSIAKRFCPNLNCVTPWCSAHVAENSDFRRPRATVKSGSFWLLEGKPCGDECFRNEDHDGITDKLPELSDGRSAREVVRIFPDQIPCVLAKICQRPCREICVLRIREFPDDMIEPSEEQPEATIPGDFFVDVKFQETPNYILLSSPCDHAGPCAEGCPCYDARLHCQRNCRCKLTCSLRWKGCNCQMTRNRKRPLCDDSCACRAIGKECDPELCRFCGPRDAIRGLSHKCCTNVVFQQERPAILEVKTGSIGLGAFATHKIGIDAYLGEYVGEFYREGDSESPRGHIRDYTDLNYLFELNATNEVAVDGDTTQENAEGMTVGRGAEPDLGEEIAKYPKKISTKSLDADKVGNETRYLNHKEVANTDVKIRLVNDEHRLGFFSTAKIKAGAELFLNYGGNYWIAKQPEDF